MVKDGKTEKQPGKEVSQLVTSFHPLDKVGIVKGEIRMEKHINAVIIFFPDFVANTPKP